MTKESANSSWCQNSNQQSSSSSQDTEQQKKEQKAEEQQPDMPTSETDTPPSSDSQPKSWLG